MTKVEMAAYLFLAERELAEKGKTTPSKLEARLNDLTEAVCELITSRPLRTPQT